MKYAVLIPLYAFLFLAACQNVQPKPEKVAAPAAQPAATDPEVVYECPMHPEITGKKGDKCSICKMDLTEKK